jgi:protein-disulfide isomerase/uncharacterized membrane protein
VSVQDGLKTSRGWRLRALNLLFLIGVGLAIQLTHHFYEVRNGTATFHSFCNLSSVLNCNAVAASSFAELLPGSPLSSWVGGWYLGLFLLSLLAHGQAWRPLALLGIGLGLTISTLISLIYLSIMVFQLKTLCLFCLFLDGIALTALAVFYGMRAEVSGQAVRQNFKSFSSWGSLLGVMTVSLLVGVLGGQALNTMVQPPEEKVLQVIDQILNSPPVVIDSSASGSHGDSPAWGSVDAPIQILEFSDFQCPYCRFGALAVHAATDAFPGQVRIQFRNFPLDAKCNGKLQQTLHPIACEAAQVALCAHQKGKFKELHDRLFDDQALLQPGKPLEFAVGAGLDRAFMETCSQGSDVATQIQRDLLDGERLGVVSTPTFFVNGHRVEGAMPVSVWKGLFSRILNQTQAQGEGVRGAAGNPHAGS